MPRPLRPQIAGGMFHVTTRGNRRQDLFMDSVDRNTFLSLLDRAVMRYGWRCHSYCLLGNHVHLVAETPKPNLSSGMQFLNGQYAQYFNHRHDVGGHLFQGRFHSVRVRHTPQLLVLVRYIALNPVRAGFCGHASDWPWSSYAALLGLAAQPALLTVDLVLNSFDADRGRARAALADFVVPVTAEDAP